MDDTFKIKHAQYGSISQLSRPHFLHIFLVTEGEFIALKNTTFHHFKVGDVFYIHDYESIKQISFNGSLICLSLNNFYYYQYFQQLNFNTFKHISLKKEIRLKLLDIIDAIQHQSITNPNNAIKDLIKSIKYSEHQNFQSSELQCSYKTALIKDVVQYVNTHLTTKITCKEIANYFFVNNSFLSREFSTLMNCKLSQYITTSKIHASICDLLNGDHLNIVQQRYDFRSQNEYCYLFNNIIGCQPSDFKYHKKLVSNSTFKILFLSTISI
ncbi:MULTISPECIES: hypothetical protein [Staphylococcus]|uniref:HTH araC/xylS-type domain-containing protein n=1 Tax=Staphylococcus ureilyticus TaxID=94138 RepID=A0AB34AFM3_STAUR|nr:MULTISPECIES: hypothetical protein [Staphylococcus]AVL76715.1 transcriptional regulator [Staphylococcus cohnii]MBL0377911.1 transcriptional regulator [Staphylococcus sp. S75]MBL0382513.1 transcriptional regulator [Staphylococcus sp. S59]MBL0401405.1 transcriptional regulator [Staphylococcus sp. S36]MCT1915355.1 transcriptional regulator [Staphylococcus ureilyticus]